jgi:hypothetical protein
MTDKEERYFRDWVFTLNNPETNQMEVIQKSELIRYMIFQLELATTGTKHMQGYVEFHEPISFSNAISLFADGWIDQRRGSREQAKIYCTKEETRIDGPWTFGEWIEDDEYQEQCLAFTRAKKRCKNFAIWGEDTCKTHRPNS